MRLGYGAIVDHVGSAGVPAVTRWPRPPGWSPDQPTGNVPPSGPAPTRRSGAPCAARTLNADPPSWTRLTLAAAVPVFLIVIVCVVVLPSTCEAWIADGTTESRPASSVKSASVAPPAAM